MNFDELLKNYKAKTCIISVERFSENDYGNIKVVAGNQAHCDDIAHITGHPFVPGCPYEMCFPKNLNFEDFCFRCAFGAQPLHTYVSLYEMGLWLNMFLIPFESDQENIGYCIYTYDVTPQADTKQMSDVSMDVSTKVLETCIKFRGSTDFEKTINEVIHDIREICESEHCCILMLDKDEKKCYPLAEALMEGSEGTYVSEYIDDDFYVMAENWVNTLQGSTCIIAKDERDMEKLKEVDPVWYDSLKEAKVNSIVLFPLKHGEEFLGYIWASNFNVENTVKIKEALELSTFFIASEISNYRLMKRMEILSSIDLLTGLKNRNIMNNRIDRVIAGKDTLREPYAIVFADLNGLKRVNDTEGHNSGDEMIREAASIIQSVFFDSEVYRAGGDEFMVISCGISKEEVEKRVEDLRSRAAKSNNVRMAVGLATSEEEEDILKAMRAADKNMYEDKDAYYWAHPELKYR